MNLQSYESFDGTLASMTFIIDLDAYDLHSGDEKIFNDVINEC